MPSWKIHTMAPKLRTEAQDVHEHSLDRHHDRAGHHEQQHEGRHADQRRGEWEAGAQSGLDVGQLGRRSADLNAEAGFVATNTLDERGCLRPL
jgi:hypothetical protein